VGIVGLEMALERVRQRGLEDELAIKEELLREISSNNYIPGGYEEEYKEALYREYKAFLAQGRR